jgi:hypothetical protein
MNFRKPRRAARPNRGRWKAIVIAGALFSLIAASLVLPMRWGTPAQNGTIPAATSTVNQSPSPSKEYIYVGGRLIAIEEPPSSVVEPPSSFNLLATAELRTRVVLRWTAPAGSIGRYQVERKQGRGGFVLLNSNLSAGNLSFNDDTVEGDKAYVYRVLAFPPGSVNPSAYSNRDLATTIFFKDDPLVPTKTPIRALHITELRLAIGAVRDTAELAEAAWPPPDAQVNGRIYARHVQDLRDNLDPALVGLQLPPPSPYDPDPSAISPGLTVKAAHLQQIRDRVK